jgi:hypothetical protein
MRLKLGGIASDGEKPNAAFVKAMRTRRDGYPADR